MVVVAKPGTIPPQIWDCHQIVRKTRAKQATMAQIQKVKLGAILRVAKRLG